MRKHTGKLGNSIYALFSKNPEAIKNLLLFVGYNNIADHSPSRTGLAPLNEFLNLRFISVCHCFYISILSIFYPAAHSYFISPVFSTGSEKNALNFPFNYQMNCWHKIFENN